MEITDKYIGDLFAGSNFGTATNESVDLQRKLLRKSIGNQIDGYWAGSTLYWIMVHGGFIVDGKRSTHKKLTALGELFMKSGDK